MDIYKYVDAQEAELVVLLVNTPMRFHLVLTELKADYPKMVEHDSNDHRSAYLELEKHKFLRLELRGG